ncbi:hypothetical protein NDU88_009128 [Pleurodeles waltl]|uniref:Uncharacterized protein n=1 Tax=Pleurodeles waltl TaxID=8319 RepID=A0AAV7PTQ4_PLEWA|nr:hypothetical protein NDU88_009128 [Pleurodeles waltl]
MRCLAWSGWSDGHKLSSLSDVRRLRHEFSRGSQEKATADGGGVDGSELPPLHGQGPSRALSRILRDSGSP